MDISPQMAAEATAASSVVKGRLTELFRALDRDQDGYLLVSDIALLGRVMLGHGVSEKDARTELQWAKLCAERKLGTKTIFQPDVLCLEEFLASSIALGKSVPEAFDDTIRGYIEAIKRVTGIIPRRELVMMKLARDHFRTVKDSKRTLSQDDDVKDSLLKDDDSNSVVKGSNRVGADMLRMRSSRALFNM